MKIQIKTLDGISFEDDFDGNETALKLKEIFCDFLNAWNSVKITPNDLIFIIDGKRMANDQPFCNYTLFLDEIVITAIMIDQEKKINMVREGLINENVEDELVISELCENIEDKQTKIENMRLQITEEQKKNFDNDNINLKRMSYHDYVALRKYLNSFFTKFEYNINKMLFQQKLFRYFQLKLCSIPYYTDDDQHIDLSLNRTSQKTRLISIFEFLNQRKTCCGKRKY